MIATKTDSDDCDKIAFPKNACRLDGRSGIRVKYVQPRCNASSVQSNFGSDHFVTAEGTTVER